MGGLWVVSIVDLVCVSHSYLKPPLLLLGGVFKHGVCINFSFLTSHSSQIPPYNLIFMPLFNSTFTFPDHLCHLVHNA